MSRFVAARNIITNQNSLRYHRLHPEYIHTRIEKLGRSYNLRILLIMCDVVSGTLHIVFAICSHYDQTEHQELIRELTKVPSCFPQNGLAVTNPYRYV
jgi:hypothetical protein